MPSDLVAGDEDRPRVSGPERGGMVRRDEGADVRKERVAAQGGQLDLKGRPLSAVRTPNTAAKVHTRSAANEMPQTPAARIASNVWAARESWRATMTEDTVAASVVAPADGESDGSGSGPMFASGGARPT